MSYIQMIALSSIIAVNGENQMVDTTKQPSEDRKVMIQIQDEDVDSGKIIIDKDKGVVYAKVGELKN